MTKEQALRNLRRVAGELRPRQFGESSTPTLNVLRTVEGQKVILRNSHGVLIDVSEEVAALQELTILDGFIQFEFSDMAKNLFAIHIGDALCERPDQSLHPCIRFGEVRG